MKNYCHVIYFILFLQLYPPPLYFYSYILFNFYSYFYSYIPVIPPPQH